MNLSLAWAKKCVVLKRCEVRMTPAKQLGVLRLAYGCVGNRAAPSHLAFGLDYGSTIKNLGIRYLFQGLSKIGVQGVLHDSPYLSS